MHIIINFVLFQFAWFACVLGAANAMPWIGVVVTIAVGLWHFFQAKQAQTEFMLIIIAMIIGGLFDQTLLSLTLIHYESHGFGTSSMNAFIVPIWIIALWAGFATTLNRSLRWMRNKTLLAILFGAIGGPLAYIAAEKLGAVTLTNTSLVVLSFGWAILTPLLLKLSERFDGFKT
jgi:hypothetical protein